MAAPDNATDPPEPSDSPEDSFLRFRRQLRAFFARDLRHRAGAIEDLMQETYERLRRYRPREAVRDMEGYVFQVARNVLRVWQRRDRLEQERYVSCEEPELELHAQGLSSLWVQEDGGQAIAEEEFERTLAQLPRASRVALLRQVRDGWSYQQIAEELGVSVSMVKLHIVRALNHFRVHYSMRTDR